MTNVPQPEPQTAIPVAKARLFSKYEDTTTIEGRYIKPHPVPEIYANNDKYLNENKTMCGIVSIK